MRKSDKLKNFKKTNLIVEQRYLTNKGVVNESEEAYVGKDSQGRPMYKDDEHNYWILVNGRKIEIDNPNQDYEYKPKPTYTVDLTSQSSDHTITGIEAKTDKAIMVKVKNNVTDVSKSFWVPKSQIKGNVVPAWIINKNF
jgi:ABC-type Fe3+/spermidine/putrescine transport system ATPase subunit